jgi:hypothetical protein
MHGLIAENHEHGVAGLVEGRPLSLNWRVHRFAPLSSLSTRSSVRALRG